MQFISKNYPEIIQKTAVYPKTVDDFSLAYFTIGLYDELSEWFEKIELQSPKEELIKEAGDVCWYACGICNHLNIDFIDLLENYTVDKKDINTLRLLGIVKKYYRDNKSLDIEIIKETLKIILNKVLDTLDYNQVLEINYNKLLHRVKNNTIQGDGDNR